MIHFLNANPSLLGYEPPCSYNTIPDLSLIWTLTCSQIWSLTCSQQWSAIFHKYNPLFSLIQILMSHEYNPTISHDTWFSHWFEPSPFMNTNRHLAWIWTISPIWALMLEYELSLVNTNPHSWIQTLTLKCEPWPLLNMIPISLILKCSHWFEPSPFINMNRHLMNMNIHSQIQTFTPKCELSLKYKPSPLLSTIPIWLILNCSLIRTLTFYGCKL